MVQANAGRMNPQEKEAKPEAVSPMARRGVRVFGERNA
jgi:hypothetical protein